MVGDGKPDVSDLEKVEWTAYNSSIELPASKVATFLVERIGVGLTAVGAGLSDGRPVRSWQRGEAKPRPNTSDRLRLLFRVVFIVDHFYGPESARAFLRSASPFLGNRSPVEVIADDNVADAAQEALGAVRGFLEA
jgi:uncharacterized protein (DUF2384 family)